MESPRARFGRRGAAISIIDQTRLPHEFVVCELKTLADAAAAIKDMKVRGAPLIGVTAAYGLALAMREDPSEAGTRCGLGRASRDAPDRRQSRLGARQDARMVCAHCRPRARCAAAMARAAELAEADVALCAAIGDHGLELIREIAAKKPGGAVNILTHCNAGWLATVDWGTATAPIYKAHEAGIAVHVFVDETRPRNQGAALTAWELGKQGVSHRVIVDNAGGHLMQHGGIDLVIVGTDRTTAAGDVCNKIGTYLKALAAKDNSIPFYVAVPSPSIDFSLSDGVKEIPIEERAEYEVTHMRGITADGRIETVRLTPKGSPAANPGFDVTPARLVTGLITERGVIKPEREALATAFPERVVQTMAGGSDG